jgi:hypothetical protein
VDYQKLVVTENPHATCSDHKIKMSWPGTPDREKYLVLFSPIQSVSAGQGDTPEEAWEMAYWTMIRRKAKKLGHHTDETGRCVCGIAFATWEDFKSHIVPIVDSERDFQKPETNK